MLAVGTRGPHLLPHLPPAAQVVKLKAFSKFENTAEALQAAASLVDSKLSKGECRAARLRRPGAGRCVAHAAHAAAVHASRSPPRPSALAQRPLTSTHLPVPISRLTQA